MILDIFNAIFFISFLIFAYLNLNDKDSWLWVPIYLVPAVLCGLSIFDLYFPLCNLIFSIAYILYALKLFFVKDGVRDWIRTYHTPSLVASMQADKPYIELTREFFGLLIVVFVLLINYFLN